jgi:hypothetical protein
MLGVKVVRPFLSLPPAFLKEFLRASGVGWTEDPSNQNRNYQRICVRERLKSLDLGVEEFWKKHIQHLQTTRQNQEATWRGWIRTFAQWLPPDSLGLPAAHWQTLALSDKEGVLRIVLEAVGGRKRHPPGLRLLRTLINRLDGPGVTGGGCVIRKKKLAWRESSWKSDGKGEGYKRDSQKKDFILFQREHSRIRPIFIDAGTSDLMWDGRYYLSFPKPLSQGVWITARGTCEKDKEYAKKSPQGSVQKSPSSPVVSPLVHSSPQTPGAGILSLAGGVSLNVPPPFSALWLGHHLWEL